MTRINYGGEQCAAAFQARILAAMYVLLVSGLYPTQAKPHSGIFIHKHAKAIARLHPVVAVSLQLHPEEGFHEQWEEDGVTAIVAGFRPSVLPPGTLRQAQQVWRKMQATRQLISEVERKYGRPAIVHGYHYGWGFHVARILHRKWNVPYYLGEVWSGYAFGEYERLPGFRKRMTTAQVRGASGVNVLSAYLRDSMMACGLENRYTITPAIVEDPGPPTPMASGPEIRVYHIADFRDAKKNTSGLIRAFTAAHQAEPRLRLHIIGDGADEAMLKQLASDAGLLGSAIIFEGVMPNTEVFRHLSRAAFYVTSSHIETFNTANLEALACGRPIITTDCGGPSDYFIPEIGIMVPKADDVVLTGAILDMVGTYRNFDPTRLHHYATSRFSYSAVSGLFRELYNTQMH